MSASHRFSQIALSKARSALRALRSTQPSVDGAAYISADGILLATDLANGVDADRFGAMCASIVALAQRTATEAHRGKLLQLIVDATGGPLLLTGTEAGVLAVSAKSGSQLGKLIIDVRHTARALSQIHEP